MPIQQLPTRPLGNTGHDVSILSLGGVKYNFLDDADAAAVVHRAIDLGINYIDTAHGYQDSERKIGLVMAERRNEVFLATKTIKRDRDSAAREIEESLKRLQTDCIDCLKIHDVHNEEQLRKVLAPNGALKAVEDFQRSGAIRFIGVTSHVDPEVLARAMREYPFDILLTSLGAVHEAVRPFHRTIMPVAQERGVGVVAMKAMAYGFLENHVEHALRFTMGLPGVASALVGVDNIDQLEQNVAVARDFAPLTEGEQAALLADARQIYESRRDDAWFIHPEAQATPS